MTTLAWAQTAQVTGAIAEQNTAPVVEAARFNTLLTSYNGLLSTYNTLKRAFDRYDRCATMGMGYAPNGTAITGYVADTGCVPLPAVLGPLVTEIQFTTANTTGDMSAYGANAQARIEGFMNANGCPTTTWHVCGEDEVLYAFARNMSVLQSTTVPTAWYMGLVRGTKLKFSGKSVSQTEINFYCDSWTSSSSAISVAGTGLELYNSASFKPGVKLLSCNTSAPVLCCQ